MTNASPHLFLPITPTWISAAVIVLNAVAMVAMIIAMFALREAEEAMRNVLSSLASRRDSDADLRSLSLDRSHSSANGRSSDQGS